jgi:predicted KAP-like P-loop ATPase
MNVLKETLEKDSQVKCIWFNPWKYDQKDELWHALIQTILAELEKSAVTKEMLDMVNQLIRTTTWLAFKSVATGLSGGVVSGDALDKLNSIIGNKDTIYYQHINHFENDFAKAVKMYVGGEKGKLVIFIDDLDRCLPENAITVLESLKLFLSQAQCIFILGMDHYIVEEGINVRYEKKIRMTGRDYLDKIIQIPFYLPLFYQTIMWLLETISLSYPNYIILYNSKIQ